MSTDRRQEEAAMIESEGAGRHRSQRRPKYRLRLIIPLAAVVAAGVIAGGAAALNPFSAATNSQVRPGDPNAQAIGTGKVLALGASDEISVGTRLTQDIRFAPGYESWRAGTIAFQTSLGPGAPRGHAYMTSSALRWQVAESAACSWLTYYVTSRAAGNSTAASNAAAQINGARSWPAITGLDYPDGLRSAVAAVNAGDGKLVQALIGTGQAGNCLSVGPFPPAAMSDAAVQAKLAAARQAGHKEIAGDTVARSLGING